MEESIKIQICMQTEIQATNVDKINEIKKMLKVICFLN